MADEHSLVDFEVIEQADEIAGQVLDVVGFDRFGPVGRAIAALVRRNHPNAGFAQSLDLVAPRKRDLGPAVAENDRRLVGLRAGFIEAHANPVGLGKLQRRHFDHWRLTLIRGSCTSAFSNSVASSFETARSLSSGAHSRDP